MSFVDAVARKLNDGGLLIQVQFTFFPLHDQPEENKTDVCFTQTDCKIIIQHTATMISALS